MHSPASECYSRRCERATRRPLLGGTVHQRSQTNVGWILPPRLGVHHTVVPSANLENDLRELTEGHLPDVVIDATGDNLSMSSAFGYVAHGGRLVFVGITPGDVTFRHPVFHKKEGTLLCSRNALPEDFDTIIRLIEDGRIDTRPWITHRAAFDDVIDVFPSYTRPETGVIKAIIDVT